MANQAYDPNDPNTWLDPSGNPVGGSGVLAGEQYDPNANQDAGQSARAQMLSAVDPGSYDPTGASSGQPDTSNGPPPAPPDPNTGAPNTPAPGNDANQIQGWVKEYLGKDRSFSDADIAALQGQPLDAVMHGIANSPEADAYNKANKLGNYKPQAPSPGPLPGPLPGGNGGGGGGSVYIPPSSIGPNADTTAFNAKLRAFMLSQIGDLSTPTDENSPEVAPSLSAYRNQNTRDQQSLRDAQAERFYAQGEGGGEGLSSGGFTTALTHGAEAGAASRANFSGSLIYNASQAKRQQLQAMMQTAVNAGDTQSAQDIQAQIATIDGQLRSRGLDQQNTQFNDQLAKQWADLIAQQNRDSVLAALTGNGA